MLGLYILIPNVAEARSSYSPWSTNGACQNDPCQTHHDSIIAQAGDLVEYGFYCNPKQASDGFWIHVYRDNGTVFFSDHVTNIGEPGILHYSGTVQNAQTFSVNFQADAGNPVLYNPNGTPVYGECDWDVYFGDGT